MDDLIQIASPTVQVVVGNEIGNTHAQQGRRFITGQLGGGGVDLNKTAGLIHDEHAQRGIFNVGAKPGFAVAQGVFRSLVSADVGDDY